MSSPERLLPSAAYIWFTDDDGYKVAVAEPYSGGYYPIVGEVAYPEIEQVEARVRQLNAAIGVSTVEAGLVKAASLRSGVSIPELAYHLLCLYCLRPCPRPEEQGAPDHDPSDSGAHRVCIDAFGLDHDPESEAEAIAFLARRRAILTPVQREAAEAP